MDINLMKTQQSRSFTLMRAAEVAQVLNVSASLAYKLMESGAIPTVRMNRSVRVRPEDLNEYIQRCWSGWKSKSDIIN
jgi:excisionase family DNA binding protein